jgi:ElaB/YqjD/DUF883 family membrane-anchored ribosome-binding protein
MKDSRDLEAELMSLRTSLRVPQKSRASLVEAGIGWLKHEVEQAVPEQMQGRLGKWRDRAEELLSNHPVASAAVALCIGLALGQLWRRHHDR